MPQFPVTGVLLDIEGTTSSISFVYDVMFPYVRRELDAYLESHWDDVDCREACDLIATEGNLNANSLSAQAIGDEVIRLMDDDVKSTGLKQLQGLIWKAGFESGEMQAHLYEDVPPALIRWNADGRDVRIYSSGSVAAQRLFFGHTEYGDLLKHFGGHYDTTTGPKKESESYTKIAEQFAVPASEILFVSDVVAELDAAREADLQTCLCIRPGNQQVAPGHGHAAVSNFAQLEFV